MEEAAACHNGAGIETNERDERDVDEQELVPASEPEEPRKEVSLGSGCGKAVADGRWPWRGPHFAETGIRAAEHDASGAG